MDILENTNDCLQKGLTKIEKLIEDLTSLRDEIQTNVQCQKNIGKYCAINGILSGVIVLGGLICSPVSGGGSLCAAFGTAYGIVVGGVDVITELAYTVSINQKLTEAHEGLEEHEETIKKICEHLEQLNKYVKIVAKHIEDIEQKMSENEKIYDKGMKLCVKLTVKVLASEEISLNSNAIICRGGEIYRLLKLQKPLRKLMSSITKGAANEATKGAAKEAAKEAAKGVAKTIAKDGSKKVAEETAAKILGISSALTIIADMRTYVSNQNDLAKFKKGKLCTQAKTLDWAIEDLKDEYKVIRKCLETTTAALRDTNSSTVEAEHLQERTHTLTLKNEGSCSDLNAS